MRQRSFNILFSDAERIKLLFILFRIFCGGIALLGCGRWHSFHDPHWLNRAGGIIVASSLFLTFAQFKYEQQGGKIPSENIMEARRRLEEKGFSEAERHAVITTKVENATAGFEKLRYKIF